MSIKTKIIGCFVGVLLLFSLASYITYLRSKQTNERLVLVNELFLPLSRQIVQLQNHVSGLAEDMKRFYFDAGSAQNSEGSSFARMVRDLYPYIIQKRFLTLERLLSKKDESGKEVVSSELVQLVNQAHSVSDKLIAATDRAQFEPLLLSLKSQLQVISKRVDDECQNITKQVQAEGKENIVTSSVLTFLVMLVGALMVFLCYRVLNPLPLLISSVKKIADGDFNQSLKIKSSDKGEVALLAREYNRMLVALQERDGKIKRQQEELLLSEKLAAIGQLSAEVVHEIRNPLNSMSLNADWLEGEIAPENTEVLETVKAISREIKRLNQITESYLARSRVTVPENQKTEINSLIREIVDFEKTDINNISVVENYAAEEIFVRGDKGQLKQAFLNVIKNAKEAMPRGGELQVRTEVKDNVSRIFFSDTGHGMSDTTKKKTFQPFFTTKASGTGIGLTVTKEIIENINGTIECMSEMGKGTTFMFQFPV